MRKGKIWIWGFLVCAFAVACSETGTLKTEGVDEGYYPLKIGLSRTYEVSGVRYNSYADSVEFSYLLKEIIADTLHNLEGGISYKIVREKQYAPDESWQIDSVWTARKDIRRIVLVAHNTPVIKITFPVSDGKSWDANGLNAKPEEQFTMTDVHKSFVGTSETFDNTITVIERDFPDIFVNSFYVKEIYSEGIGPVYMENVILFFRQGDDYGKGIIDHGIKYYQRLISHEE